MSDLSLATPEARLAHALSIYAEPLVTGRRVLVVGDASSGIGERLSQLGARVVHVYDPDAERARASATSRGVSVRELPAGDFDVRDGAFDLALVPDLGIAGDPAQLMVRLRRLLGNQGAALVAARNAEAGEAGEASRAFDYYELYDVVSLQFEHARMIAQVPFVGVALAELGNDEDLQVSVDAQLAGPPAPPSVFVVLASQREVRLDPYAIVQLPPEAAAPAVEAGGGEDLERTRMALTQAQLQADLLAAQLEEQRAASTRLAAQAASSARAADLEAELGQAAAKVRDAEARAGDNHVRAERLTHEIKKLEDELQRQRDRNFRLVREAEDEKKARQKAELELGMIRKSPELSNARERVSYLEEALRSSEEVGAALQARVAEVEAAAAARAEQLALLVAEVEALRVAAEMGQQAAQHVDELQHRLDVAEQRAASLEAELAHDDAHASELAHLEATLRERARAIHGLEQELARRERIVQELVGALEEHAPGAVDAGALDALMRENDDLRRRLEAVAGDGAALRRENAELRQRVEGLAAHAARAEGEAQAAGWRVAELEQQLAAAASRTTDARPPSPEASGELAAALEQIDVLKQALAQEHEARRRFETGEELSRARAELQRQATLIEQLSRELEALERPGAGREPAPMG